MSELFLQVLNLSFNGSIAILFVLLCRWLLKPGPKLFSYLLWSVAAFRLTIPFSMESVLSLLPVKPNPIPSNIGFASRPAIDTGVPFLNNPVNAALPAATPEASVNPMQIWLFAGSVIWLAGLLLLLGYSVFSLVGLKKRLRSATCSHENVYLCEGLETAFVLGVFSPRIYLPAHLTDRERDYILLHEKTHIKRFDHVVKVPAFFLLCVHWFNPLVWIAFFLWGRDMELSCDESVMKQLSPQIRKEYASSLLRLATGKPILSGVPLAFGEGDTSVRIKNVLRFKKPALWVMILCGLITVCLVTGLALNPKKTAPSAAASMLTPKDAAEMVRLTEPSATVEFDGDVTVQRDKAAYAFRVTLSSEQESEQQLRRAVVKEDRTLWEYDSTADTWHQTPPLLTLEQVAELSKKGDALSWSDFDAFFYQEAGAGLYIRRYPIDKTYTLMIGGANPKVPPMYIRLALSADAEVNIDVREKNVEAFLKEPREPSKDIPPNAAATADMTFEYTGSPEPMFPQFRLNPQNSTFTSYWSALDSFFHVGTYTEEQGRLTLKDDSGTYVFEQQKDGYIFLADQSSPLSKYAYQSGSAPQPPFPDKALSAPRASDEADNKSNI